METEPVKPHITFLWLGRYGNLSLYGKEFLNLVNDGGLSADIHCPVCLCPHVDIEVAECLDTHFW